MAYNAYNFMTLDEMLSRIEKYTGSTESRDLITRAYRFAEKAHEGQVRKNGDPYIVHPMTVASILTELTIDPPTIAAALLHDTVEDVEGVTIDRIQQEFGDEVARLVDGVTRILRTGRSSRPNPCAK